MSQKHAAQKWDRLRLIHGTTLRTVAALPSDQIHRHPIAGMRSPAELVVHMYDSVICDLACGIARGEVPLDDPAVEAAAAAKIVSREELIERARARWSEADAAVATLTDAQLAGSVRTPWSEPVTGGFILHIAYDEFLHHRGQLYVFARALGVEPPMNWDFKNNEPALQPRAAASA
jgi:uncharacterized damage-inducible protein DinB